MLVGGPKDSQSSASGLGAAYLGFPPKIHQAVHIYDLHTFFVQGILIIPQIIIQVITLLDYHISITEMSTALHVFDSMGK